MFRDDPKAAKFETNAENSEFERKILEYESRIIPGLGQYGEAAYLEGEDKEKGELMLKEVALNTVLSDRMPLDRKLRDPRHRK